MWHVIYKSGVENVVSFKTKAEAVAWAKKYCEFTPHRIVK